MLMRMFMVFILLLALTSCLQKNVGEGVSMDTAVSKETAANAVSEEEEVTDIQEQGVQEEEAVDESLTSTAEAFVKPSVQEIQQALKNADLYEGNIDGISGPKTKKAIKDFQAQNNLVVDGRVGPKTWAVLKEYLNKASERTGEEKE